MNTDLSDLGAQPMSAPSASSPGGGSDLSDLGAVPVAGAQHVNPAQQGGGLLKTAGDIAGGTLNFINNNPISRGITSLAAMPVQLLAKALGQKDPYAGGIGTGPGAVHVTSSDQPMSQYLEEQAGNAATVGSLFIPAGRIAGAAETGLKSVLPEALSRFAGPASRIATQAGVGAVQGAGGAMQSGGNVHDITGGIKTGSILGGSLSSAGELGSALLDSVAGTTGATRLTEHVEGGGAAKTLTRAFNDASTADTNPIQTMDQNGLIKDLRVVNGHIVVDHITNPTRTGTLDSLIQDQQDMGSQAVKNMQGGVPIEQFKKAIVETVKANPALKASGNVGKMTAEIGRRFEDYTASYGDTLSYQDIDQIRKAMNRVWDPETWDAEKAIGNASRAALYSAADDSTPLAGGGGVMVTGTKGANATTLKSAMKNEQELINAKEFLQKLSGTTVKGGRLTKIIADSTAAAVGAGIGLPIPFVGPAVGAGVSAYATNKVINAMQEGYFNPAMGGYAKALQPFAPALSAAKTIGQGSLIPSLTATK